MFVLLQCWENLAAKEKGNRAGGDSASLEERIGRTMRHAGVAVTVTSLTDVCAFAVGAVTVCNVK